MKRAIVVLIAVGIFATQAAAATIKEANVEAELVAEDQSIKPGRPLWVGLRLKMDPGWHTYWENPGDSGMSTRITWQLPPGFEAGPIQWPYPKKFFYPDTAGYGYDGETLLLAEIKPPADLSAGRPVSLKAAIRFVSCEEICVPGRAEELTLELPVQTNDPLKNTQWTSLFDAAKHNVPVKESPWQIQAFDEGAHWALRLVSSGGLTPLTQLEFFPRRDDLINHFAVQDLRPMSDGYELLISKSTIAPKEISRLEGVLVSQEGFAGSPALSIDVPIERR